MLCSYIFRLGHHRVIRTLFSVPKVLGLDGFQVPLIHYLITLKPSHFVIGIPGSQKVAFLIHSSEYPRTTFLILESLLCLVAENSLDTIFSHLKQFYPPRKQPKIEVKGKCYHVKQYTVKFGAISVGSTNRGIVVEVRLATEPT